MTNHNGMFALRMSMKVNKNDLHLVPLYDSVNHLCHYFIPLAINFDICLFYILFEISFLKF